MTPSTSDLTAGAVVTVLFLGIVASAEAWRRWGNPKPEWTRKLIHMAGGVVSLFLPFIIQSPLVVLFMALGMAVLFIAGKLTGKLKSLHGVSRKSSGTEYYPVVIFLLFYFTQGEPWKYFICVLVLTTADALAALVGSRYGRLRYEVDQNYKSVEGSLVFFVVTLLAVFVPLALFPRPDPTPLFNSFLVAVLVALLTTGFEAVAQDGRDNVWVPLGTLIILNQTLHLPLDALTIRVVVLIAMGAVAGIAAWRSATFNVGGTLVLILAAYASWALTTLDWALPIFFASFFYVVVELVSPARTRLASTPMVKALALPFCVIIAAAVLRTNHATEAYHALYGPFLAACITITALALWDESLRYRQLRTVDKGIGPLVATLVTSAVVIGPCYAFQPDVSWTAPLGVMAGALAVGYPASLVSGWALLTESNQRWWLARVFAITAAMGMVGLLQVIGLIGLWHPH